MAQRKALALYYLCDMSVADIAAECASHPAVPRLNANLGVKRMSDHHRLGAVRAHPLETAGDLKAARGSYLEAAKRTTSLPERRYLDGKAARLVGE